MGVAGLGRDVVANMGTQCCAEWHPALWHASHHRSVAAMVDRVCWCGKHFNARPADIKRGWAKACSKSHAAIARERKLDRNDFKHGGQRRDRDEDIDYEGGGWDAHK